MVHINNTIVIVASIFVVLTHHQESDGLESEVCHPSLENALKDQKEIGALIKMNCFISIGDSQKFNQKQNEAILKWIQGKTEANN